MDILKVIFLFLFRNKKKIGDNLGEYKEENKEDKFKKYIVMDGLEIWGE